MASLLHPLLIFLSFSSLVHSSQSQTRTRTIFKPNKLVLPMQKDTSTGLHVANIYSPLLQVPFVVDLNGQFLWENCQQQYLSSTYYAPYCHSTHCSRANSHYCYTCLASTARLGGCHNNTCGLLVSTQGSNQGPMARVLWFLFACLPKNVQGVIGLGHAPIAVPIQLASHFGFQPKFALFIFFGDGPYHMLTGIDVSHPLSFTPLTISREGEYYIEVSSIKINNKLVPLRKSLFSINKRGLGGTMISTPTPYTLSGIPQVKPVAPFEVCYDSNKILSSRLGPAVPNIDLELHSPDVVWRIFGANLMVRASKGVTCLGFVDEGSHPRASIVIGAYQLEDNLLQFDLDRSRLGFSSLLLFRRTNCANFNFATTSP
ncbi:hypothetical protein CIPAW_07G015500 [Carya illinoinensis]|uniref:Peptidase A1 domain-containing protein n=1 Tax=Carya illinoinensis TaxID=32201 RepID=A0A8T1PY70_CARIL|nr:hypothetical protein CIPAW_07G015500 [Carya illinoinensis]